MNRKSQAISGLKIKRKEIGKRLSPHLKQLYIHEINKRLLQKDTVCDIADELGISTASVYRWLRNNDELQHGLNKEAISHIVDVESAISILCQNKNVSTPTRRNALFQFLTWLRWPSEPQYHLPAMINITATYLSRTNSSNNIGELDKEEAAVIFRYLTLDVAARFCSPSAAFNPDFEIVTNATGRYNDLQFYAQVINYLLAPDGARGSATGPTLSSLQVLVEEGAIHKDWAMSPRTFNKYWRLRAASFPFLYIEHYHSRLDWSINPQDNDFVECVGEALADRAEVKRYFGKVRWVVEQLSTILDPRALREIRFPAFPSDLETVPVENPALSARLQTKIDELL